MSNITPGWYDDGSGRKRWWTGADWSDHFEDAAPGAPAKSSAEDKLASQPGTIWSAVGKPLSGIGAGKYRLTESILYFEKGTLSTKAQQIHVAEIHDVDASQTMTQKARGIGTIKLHAIRSVGRELVLLEDIPNFREGVAELNRVSHAARVTQQQRAQTQYVNHNGSYQPAVAPASSGPAPASDLNAEIARLAQFHQSGVLSDEEFAAAKRKLLGL